MSNAANLCFIKFSNISFRFAGSLKISLLPSFTEIFAYVFNNNHNANKEPVFLIIRQKYETVKRNFKYKVTVCFSVHSV